MMLAASAWVIGLATGAPTLLSFFLLWQGLRSLRRRRLIQNVPTSKVEGVFLGLTEVQGTAERTPPLRSYLAEADTVYYRFNVEEQVRRTETYTDSKGRRRTRTKTEWRSVRSGEQRVSFLLRDDTGAIRIRPEKAEVDAERILSRTCGPLDPMYYSKGPRFALAGSTRRRRFTEHAIRLQQNIYVIGSAQLRQDVLEPEIRHDRDEEMFLISVRSEEQIARSYAWKAFFSLLTGWVMGALGPVGFAMSSQGLDFVQAVSATRLMTGGVTGLYWLFVFALYLQLVYNGLVDVRNRLRRAFSMIDVELKRRYDLIPNLVSLVSATADHERSVQEAAVQLRTAAVSSGGSDLPDAAGAMALASAANAQTNALAGVFSHVERYPELKSNTAFLKLSEELARTERRIALARSFYNDSVAAYNDRVHTLPDVLLARPFGFASAPHLPMEEFARHPVEVRFEAEPEPIAEPVGFDDTEPLPEGAVAVSEAEMAVEA
jgi:hypothetical protein